MTLQDRLQVFSCHNGIKEVVCCVYDYITQDAAGKWLEILPGFVTKKIAWANSPRLIFVEAAISTNSDTLGIFWLNPLDMGQISWGSTIRDSPFHFQQEVPLNGDSRPLIIFGGITKEGLDLIEKVQAK